MKETELETRDFKIKVGDVVRIRSKEEIRQDYADGFIVCGWNDYMYVLCGNEYVVTPEMVERANQGFESIFQITMPERTFAISLSMLELVNGDDIAVPDTISLKNENQDPTIIAEMIKKVDIMRFKKLLCIASCDSRVRPDTINEKIVMKYLNLWAKAKYDFYLLFGRELIIDKQVDLDMDEDDMVIKIDDLARSYPEYANLIKAFNSNEFLNNESYGYNRVLGSVYPAYKRGAKLTKVFAGLVKDKSFKDSLANMLEDRKIKSNLSLSIDPYDYFTMSVNNYGWQSCQKIGSGNHIYATGGGSIMLDDATIIAYRHSNKNEEYRMSNLSFKGNSKSWRQLIFVDKHNCTFISAREYPSEKPILAKELRLTLEHLIGNYLGIDNDWIVSRNGLKEYVEGSENMYHDVLNGYTYKTAYIKGHEKSVTVEVGHEVYCTSCGAPIRYHQARYICRDDYDKGSDMMQDEDDDELMF